MTPDRFASINEHGLIRLAVATPTASVGDVAGNSNAILDLVRKAALAGADIVLFPELCLSSYAIDDLHLQDALLDRVETEIGKLIEASLDLPVLLVGAPVRRAGRLYNAALAIGQGKLLGVVPKSYLPNYREYYEKRWFASGAGLTDLDIELAGCQAPFGTDLLFSAKEKSDFIFHIEICEDYWSPLPPSTMGALAGALILCNLSASNITIGKSRDRHMLSASQSARCLAAYAYSAAGPGESTTDLAWDGQAMVHELGELLAESKRFGDDPELTLADIDVQRLRLERMRNGTFNDTATACGHPEQRFRHVKFSWVAQGDRSGLYRPQRRFPFVPADAMALDADCYEAFNIQVQGLITRFRATSSKHLIIGVSGGLDSTHALIVAAKACDRLGLPRSTILGFTMPGFATGEETRSNAWALMKALGITAQEIDIRPAARQMLSDMEHPFAAGEPLYDITFENVQAGLRTDYLFRLANRHGGFVIGTGDLSELALGWCTYGVGDQMSHYAVNCGVPKTLIQYLIRWCVSTGQFDSATDAVLTAILGTEISPELVPADASGALQSAESKVGPYALNDFFLHHVARVGLPPSKVAFLAWQAWRDADAGEWPPGYPDDAKISYDLSSIRRWLENFLFRLFTISQFKRSAIPNGPKVSSGGALSPRGDWRAPSDGTAAVWLDELAAAFADAPIRSDP
ncbi:MULTISPECIES: NAD(+) synthase [Sphingobium]|uniref:Glutamine-dependent NAD(+) synthetase n=1 Tax=Sphingobium limneticum TaxID=1007511 RepID=A0A5J5I135_9SPHN|nr:MULTISPECIES: NAD(+) synthase [Sphingobium]KAA9009580.1 NAD(+) synthase [Sphingobium limneticum]KAA9011909.1 NAD(+) synthase [Sphingobium limneticum]KAA9029232.1 NAD(+) synthase [Sphingobium limneticum]BBD01085.1 NAD(+) synthase (glutamine-hydrolyzing) [Sphingobium sp. YG1]